MPPVEIVYTNWKGKKGLRHIQPKRLYYGTVPPYHMLPQWLMDAYDLDKQAPRTFAMQNIERWKEDEASINT